MYLDFLLFLTLLLVTYKICDLFPENFVPKPFAASKERKTAIALKALDIADAKTGPANLIPYSQGALPIEVAIARRRTILAEPGGTGADKLDKFESTWRPFLSEAQKQGFFRLRDYLLALFSVIDHLAPGDTLREEIRIGMTIELERHLSEVMPLLRKHRKVAAKLIQRKKLVAIVIEQHPLRFRPMP